MDLPTPPRSPLPFLSEVFSVSSTTQKNAFLSRGVGVERACLGENGVIHTEGRGSRRNPRCCGRHPSLSAGLRASSLCSGPSHASSVAIRGDLRRPSRQEGRNQLLQKEQKPPGARPASWRCHPTPIKETSEAPGAVTPTVGGVRWSCQALWVGSLSSHVPPINGPGARRTALAAFHWGSFPRATWQGSRAGDTMVAQ